MATNSSVYDQQVEEINRRLKKYGEYIDPNEHCFRAFLNGVLDRLVYDEERMTKEEADEIRGILTVPDKFEQEFAEMFGVKLTGQYWR